MFLGDEQIADKIGNKGTKEISRACFNSTQVREKLFFEEFKQFSISVFVLNVSWFSFPSQSLFVLKLLYRSEIAF